MPLDTDCLRAFDCILAACARKYHRPLVVNQPTSPRDVVDFDHRSNVCAYYFARVRINPEGYHPALRHGLAFLTGHGLGSCLPQLFLAELRAAIGMASNTAPFVSIRYLAGSVALMVADSLALRPSSSKCRIIRTVDALRAASSRIESGKPPAQRHIKQRFLKDWSSRQMQDDQSWPLHLKHTVESDLIIFSVKRQGNPFIKNQKLERPPDDKFNSAATKLIHFIQAKRSQGSASAWIQRLSNDLFLNK